MPPSASLPVALVTPVFPPDHGGLALAVARLTQQLQCRLPLDVIALKHTGSTPSVTVSTTTASAVLRVEASSWGEAHQQAFWLLRERGPYRCLHGIEPSLTGFPVALAARYASVPYVLTSCGNDLQRDCFDPERQAALLFALRHADAVVGASRELCRLAGMLGATGRIQWIPDGVDNQQFRPLLPDETWLAELSLKNAFPQIGCIGETRQPQGLTLALRAFALLRRQYPQAHLLVIRGSHTDASSVLSAFLARHPQMRSAIHEFPWLPQERLVAYYNLLDVFWYPAINDGLPAVVLEALACGRPVIASRRGGTADILTGSPLAPLMIPPGNPLALAEMTLRLLKMEPERRAYWAKAGREWVTTRFTPSAEASAYLTLYDKLIALRHRRTLKNSDS